MRHTIPEITAPAIHATTTPDRPGLVRAATVVSAYLLVQAIVLWGPVGSAVLLPVLVFLYTGLFITAHDAMHGVVAPGRPRLNRWVGRVAAGLYAGFDFDFLRARHLQHHAAPATPEDPDHHRGDAGTVAWYLAFMRSYSTVGQLVRAAAMYWVFAQLASPERAAWGWALPALLSSVQLFVFGIARVHREPPGGWGDDPLRARTEAFPRWLSFLTSWHFGYHREHHRFPHLPWWRLPEARGLA